MQYCPKCKIKIRGQKRCCPLCQSKITELEAEEFDQPAFPPKKPRKVSRVSFFKLITFILVTAEIFFISFHYLTHRQFPWVPIVMWGLIIGWLDILITMYLRNNILKVITVEVYIAILIDYIIDKKYGFYGWSLSWMIPASFLGLCLITFIIALVSKMHPIEYISYLFLNLLLSLGQLYPIWKGMTKHKLLPVISIAVLLVINAGVLIFQSRALKSSLHRRLNF